jgi:hypothetical protein
LQSDTPPPALNGLTRPPSPQPEWWNKLPEGWEAAAAAAAAAAPAGGIGGSGAAPGGGDLSISDVLQEGAWVVIKQARRPGARQLGWLEAGGALRSLTPINETLAPGPCPGL